MNRNRLTWMGTRRASAAPATPGYAEKAEHEHPADQADPDASKYMNGDPSSWAEDPKKGPYQNSAAPAMPTEDGGHPAAKKAAMQRKLERKATKCIRIAQAVFGKDQPTTRIERLAALMMNQSDKAIDRNLQRLAGGFLADDLDFDDGFDDPMLPEVIPVEDELLLDGDGDFDGDFDAPAVDDGIYAKLNAMQAEIEALKAGSGNVKAGEDADEAMLAQMLAEEEAKKAAPVKAGEDADEALLAQMLAEDDDANEAAALYALSQRQAAEKKAGEEKKDEAGKDEEVAAKKAGEDVEEKKDEEVAAKKAGEDEVPDEDDEDDEVAAAKKAYLDAKARKQNRAADEASTFSMQSDPMGLGDHIAATADPVLEALFGKSAGGDDEGGEEAGAEEDEDGKSAGIMFAGEDEPDVEVDADPKSAAGRTAAAKASRTASQATRTPVRQGVKSLGAVPRTASGRNSEIAELENLWGSAPDVSSHF